MSTFADLIEDMCGKIEINCEKQNDDVVTVAFDMGDDRSQTVWITAVGTNPQDEAVMSIASPALDMSNLPNHALGQNAANELLMENSKVFTGAWAIQKFADGAYLVAIDNQIISTCDPEELQSSIYTVAIMADNMEKKLGVDNF